MTVLRFVCLATILLLPPAISVVRASEPFPFGTELMLDGGGGPKQKRVPMIEIEEDGTAAIDLWCSSLRAQATVGDDGTLQITPGARDNAQCDPDRVASDDDLLDRLVHMTKWRRSGEVVELSGAATLRYRQMTN